MNNKIKPLYEFDSFRADPNQKCLWRGSDLVSLTPKAFDTLVVLIENNGKVVSKEDLLNQVWADTFVEESTLAQNISTLRKVFSGKQFIETIPRRGYRFVGEVHEFFNEEMIVIEKMTQTSIFTEQEIHHSDSDKPNLDKPELVSAQPKSNFKPYLAAIVLLMVVLGLWLGFRYYFSSNNAFANKFKQFETSKLVVSGDIHRVAFSPDGKYLALVEKKGETQSLRVKQTINANTVEIVPPTKDNIIGITFSPDVQSIYYTVYQNNDSNPKGKLGIVYRVPILGGTRTEIIKDVDSPISFSPTNPNKVAFIRNAPQQKESTLMVVDFSNQTEQKISTRHLRNAFLRDGVSWSPDGNYIVSGVFNSDEQTLYQILITNVSNGNQQPLTTNNFAWLGQINWLKDGSGILAIGFTDKSPNLTDEIWLISYPDGKARQIVGGLSGLYGFGVSDDGKSIVSTSVNRASSLLITSPEKNDQSFVINQKIGDNSLINLGLETTKDGKIIYSSSQQGDNADIWIVNSDGSNLKQITDDPSADFSPKITPDGQTLVFISNRTGFFNLWRTSADGSTPKQLTEFQNVFSPSLSPDGKWVYFSALKNKNAPPLLYKVSIDGGESIQITNLFTNWTHISPDGKKVACIFPTIKEDGKPAINRTLTILSADEGKVIKQFDFPSPNQEYTSISWTPDGKSISYLLQQNGNTEIWLQPIEVGNPKRITNFQPDQVFRYEWLKDEEKIVLEKGISIKEISLIRDLVN